MKRCTCCISLFLMKLFLRCDWCFLMDDIFYKLHFSWDFFWINLTDGTRRGRLVGFFLNFSIKILCVWKNLSTQNCQKKNMLLPLKVFHLSTFHNFISRNPLDSLRTHNILNKSKISRKNNPIKLFASQIQRLFSASFEKTK